MAIPQPSERAPHFRERPRSPSLPSWLRTLPFLVLPILVLGVVWVPEIDHFSTPQSQVTTQMVEVVRQRPGNDVLEELGSFSVLPTKGRSPALEVAIAEGILQGRLELPNLPTAPISQGFSADDFDRLPAPLQIWYAGFVVPDFLLAAHVETGREDFFEAAKTFITDWDRFERGSWLPKGLLWNDHAITARVGVLAEFWRIYRARPDFEPEVGRAVLEQAARYGFFLSSAEHFTFATNHGLMQNLGLLELSLAFPSLPDVERYRETALSRLDRQLAFLLDDAGVVRENSAGYQAFDLHVLGMTFRAMTLLGEPVPDSWARRYGAAVGVLGQLARPDGTLPATGDTDGAPLSAFPLVTAIDDAGSAAPLEPFQPGQTERSTILDTAAGYWISWDGAANNGVLEASQTVVTWTSPPSPAHKHADELSVHLWSDGISWLTSVGYWPYDDAGRVAAESWDGANAPHGATEATTSQRTTELIGSGAEGDLVAVDVERSGPGDYRARRQVVRLNVETWLVLDFVSGAGSDGTRSVWTATPAVDLRPLDREGSYLLETPGATARVDFLGSSGTAFETFRGSQSPRLGWHVVDGTPQPAPAIEVTQPAEDTWLAVVITASSGGEPVDLAGQPGAGSMTSAEDWSLIVRIGGTERSVRRSGGEITVSEAVDGGTPLATLRLSAPPADAGTEAIRAAFQSMATDYPAWRPLVPRRMTVTWLIPVLFVGQELTLLLVRRRWPMAYWPLRTLSVLGWLAFALWLGLLLLQPWEVITLPV